MAVCRGGADRRRHGALLRGWGPAAAGQKGAPAGLCRAWRASGALQHRHAGRAWFKGCSLEPVVFACAQEMLDILLGDQNYADMGAHPIRVSCWAARVGCAGVTCDGQLVYGLLSA